MLEAIILKLICLHNKERATSPEFDTQHQLLVSILRKNAHPFNLLSRCKKDVFSLIRMHKLKIKLPFYHHLLQTIINERIRYLTTAMQTTSVPVELRYVAP